MQELQHAKFERLDPQDLSTVVDFLEVQYNPTEFTFNKAAQIADINIPGLDMPILQFVRGQTETLSLELFFDTTDHGTAENSRPVTEKTDKFYQLIKIDRSTHAPPICRFVWGRGHFAGSKLQGDWASQNRTNGFQCIVESVRQKFSLFSTEGTPLRATLSINLREYKTLNEQIEQIRYESPDHTHSHVIERGDTLTSIAAKTYGDATQWRAIANHNQITDPLELQLGMILEIPPIEGLERL